MPPFEQESIDQWGADVGTLRAWWDDYVNWRRVVSALAVLLVVACALLAIALSPIALARMGDANAKDWGLLSDVGQAYGATSAVLSGIAEGPGQYGAYIPEPKSPAAAGGDTIPADSTSAVGSRGQLAIAAVSALALAASLAAMRGRRRGTIR